jgi:hypothetical protein
MKRDSLSHFIKLRHALETERDQLAARLQEVTAALGTADSGDSASIAPARKGSPRKPRVARVSNTASLKEAILAAIKGKALTKEEVLAGVEGSGYQFRTKNPLNSIGTVLYGKKPKFRNEGGRFSVG